MRGSIKKRILKNGSTSYLAIWRPTPNGKQKAKTFSRKRDAEDFLNNTSKRIADGSYTDVRPLLMNELFDKWLEALDVRRMRGEVKPSTWKSYKAMVKTHLRPEFGNYRSDRLTHAVVSEWTKKLAARIAASRMELGEGEEPPVKPMAPKYYNNLLNLLHAILLWGRHPAQAYLAHDPLLGQKRLPKQQTEREFLEPEEIEKLLEAAEPPDDTIIHLAVYAGLRRGELFALKWGDVDWGNGIDGGRLRIRRSIYQGEITAPKTPNSVRVVDVTQRTLNELAMYKLGFPPLEGDLIFRQPDGSYIDGDNWCRDRFLPTVEKAGVKRVTFHCLRHTYASLLINANESIKYVSKQLGHASIQITADLYGHLFKETSMAAMKRLEQQIPSPQKVHRTGENSTTAVEQRGNGTTLTVEREKS